MHRIAIRLIVGVLSISALAAAPSEIDRTFTQESRVAYSFGDGLPARNNDGENLVSIRAIAVRDNGLPVAAAKSSLDNLELLEFDGESWSAVSPLIDHVTRTPAHNAAASRSGLAFHFDKEKQVNRVVVGAEGTTFTATEHSVWKRERVEDAFKDEKLFELEGETVLSFDAWKSGEAALGATDGLYVWNAESGAFEKVYPADERRSWAPREVAAVAYDSKRRLWFGCRQGVGVRDGEEWRLFTGAEGLPYDRFTCAAAGGDGAIWFGTERGAIRFDGEKWAYRASSRWLPDDFVNDIAVDETGNAWIATPKGVSHIVRTPMTLQAKARRFIDATERHNQRDGYIAPWRLAKRGEVDSAVPAISDNDGQYTSMYGAAMAFRYAATGSEEAKRLARRSFEACKALVDVVPESMKGFPARVRIPVDWPEPVNEQYGAEYNRRKKEGDPYWKLITPRFPLSEDGKHRWKNDTSSDELAGHYFIYSIYYDLVATTEAEKTPAREVVRDITDHLIRNNFALIDHDGAPTRWGRFGPDYIYSLGGYEQRGLNSLMMLSMLAVAEHVTGDSKYAETAKRLREEHHYHNNVTEPVPYFPPDNVVPWDINLALMSFYPLMKYETDPRLLLLYRTGLENLWLFVSQQKNAFWNFAYGACAQFFAEKASRGVFDGLPLKERLLGRFSEVDYAREDALDTLRGLPLELLGWNMPNSHRLDVELDRTPGQAPGFGWSRVDGKALPIEERAHVRQDRAPFQIDNVEGDGWTIHEGTIFLLPYYLAIYHGLI